MTQKLWNQLNDQQAESIAGGKIITRTFVEEDTIVYDPNDEGFSEYNLSNYTGVPNPRSGFIFVGGSASYSSIDGDTGYWDYASITLRKQTGPKK